MHFNLFSVNRRHRRKGKSSNCSLHECFLTVGGDIEESSVALGVAVAVSIIIVIVLVIFLVIIGGIVVRVLCLKKCNGKFQTPSTCMYNMYSYIHTSMCDDGKV